MKRRWKRLALSLLLLMTVGIGAVSIPPRRLMRHGSVTCDGLPIPNASVYRSRRGDIFIFGADIQPAIISPQDGQLGRCNPGAFVRVFGSVFSRDAEPDAECTSMWKGGGSENREPPHIVNRTHAEFPWGSCSKLRSDY